MNTGRTRVKICGITRVQDALAAARAGVDAIGLVFHPDSPRYLPPDSAVQVLAELPPLVTVVGLFLDAPAARVRSVLEQVPVDLLQFHGRETADYCRAFGRPYIKAVPMGDGSAGFTQAFAAAYPDARGFLVDSHTAGGPGGSGRQFDWQRLDGRPSRPLVLAGGLTPENVTRAVREVTPWAVDVSSGVEVAPGHKDATLIQRFMQGVDSGFSD